MTRELRHMIDLCIYAGTTLFLLHVLVSSAAADAVPFRRHDINAESTYPACAAFDVNHDGRIDIVCGGYWYEAPDWKKHSLRDVPVIRGRYDDYSHLPLDVNGDGWTDFISANYRSRTIRWIEHPGPSLGLWKTHTIATPGPMETARLADIDGDGRLDILPNGLKFAAWWELVPSDEGRTSTPQWVRHDLPEEITGHGIGFGDINGDGRGDIVGPRGWLEAPKDRRRERWIWHDGPLLNHDCGLPILVWDVDHDGDSDIVWGRGHRTGLYWQEQVQDEQGRTNWVRHAIDTSWSQPHSLLRGDLDGDGREELIAGKRYMGHDGKDPGENDPLVVYRYQFDPKSRTWHRSLISQGDNVGFGLDPKAVDIDGDGDLDLIAAGRSGLFLLENLRVNATDGSQTKTSILADAPEYKDHARLLVYQDAAGKEHPVESAWDWGRRRSHIISGVERAMGRLPDSSRRVPLDIKIHSEEDTPKYVRRRISYAAEPGDRVPAFLLVPKDIRSPAAAMLCLHPTSPLGKAQIAGLGGKPSRFYAHELANRGYVCLVPDYPSFGEYPYDFKTAGAHYDSGSMKAIWNNIRGLDLLETLNYVDGDRIGTIGHSLGGHNAIFTALFDQRIRVIASSCGFTAFHHYYGGKLEGWTSDRYMPRIRERYGNDPDQVPFDFHELIAALAPRPFFVNAPLHDSNFDVVGVKKVMAAAGDVYRLRGAEASINAVYPDAEHDFPTGVRESVYDWLDQHLKK